MGIKFILRLGMWIGVLALLLVGAMVGIAPLLPGAGQLGYSSESRFYMLDVARSIPHALLDTPTQPQWSPDGDQLVYVNRAAQNEPEHVMISQVFEPGSQVLYPTQAENGIVTHLPAWSPFDSHIAFTYTETGSNTLDLVVLEPAAGVPQIKRITRGLPADVSFTWTAADRLRYVSVHSGYVSLNELRLNETEPVAVHTWRFGTMSVRPAALSSDGTRFILPAIVPQDLNFELYLFDVESDEVRNLTNRSTYNDTNPIWSPDEQHILFRSLTDTGQFLVMMNADGSDQEILFHIKEGLFNQVNWSPDGEYISYVFSFSGSKRLCIFQAANRTVNCPAADVDQATWRPNS
jgi:Tol biopolymer transport system component